MSNENISNSLEDDSAGTGKMVSYGFTEFINSMIFAAYGFTVFYYYEVEVGLSVVLVGIALIIWAIWNMVNDPLIGYLTDKPMRWAEKWGVRRPWIFIGAFLTIIFFFFIFTPPPIDARTNPMPVFLYLIIMTALFDTFYSLYTAHYRGGFANQFRTNDERRKASGIMRLIGVIGAMGASAILIPTIIVFGDPSSFIRLALVLAILMGIAMVLMIPGTKEDEEIITRYMAGYEEREKLGFWKILRVALTSKNYMLMVIAYTFFNIVMILIMSNMFYFIKDVLNLPSTAQIMVLLPYVVSLYISVFIWIKVAKRIGPIKVLYISLLSLTAIFLLLLVVTNIFHVMIVMALGGICFGGFNGMYLSVMSDTWDEITLECECHQEATLVGINNFFIRVSYLVVAALIAIVHIATGYNPNPEATQTPLAIFGIRLLMGAFPAIFAFLGGLTLILWYDLKGEKLKELKTKLRECGL